MNIHMSTRFLQLRKDYPAKNNFEIISLTTNKMFWPILYTVLTTVFAFLSLIFSGIKPIIDFGWMMTFGLITSFIITFTLLPTLLNFAPTKNMSLKKEQDSKITSFLGLISINKKNLIFTRNRPAQNWTLTISPSDATSTSTGTTNVTFDSDGRLPAGTSAIYSITTAAGDTTSFSLDISDVTSLGQAFTYFGFQRDGRAAGELDGFHFDNSGKIVGEFTNGHQATLYKLPLATFTNADALDRVSGNLFEQSV